MKCNKRVIEEMQKELNAIQYGLDFSVEGGHTQSSIQKLKDVVQCLVEIMDSEHGSGEVFD